MHLLLMYAKLFSDNNFIIIHNNYTIKLDKFNIFLCKTSDLYIFNNHSLFFLFIIPK